MQRSLGLGLQFSMCPTCPSLAQVEARTAKLRPRFNQVQKLHFFSAKHIDRLSLAPCTESEATQSWVVLSTRPPSPALWLQSSLLPADRCSILPSCLGYPPERWNATWELKVGSSPQELDGFQVPKSQTDTLSTAAPSWFFLPSTGKVEICVMWEGLVLQTGLLNKCPFFSQAAVRLSFAWSPPRCDDAYFPDLPLILDEGVIGEGNIRLSV